MSYDENLKTAEKLGLNINERAEFGTDQLEGLVVNSNIALSKQLNTRAEKNSVLIEEVTHYKKNVGNITDLTKKINLKQELKARKSMVLEFLPINLIVDTVIDLKEEATPARIAEELEITEKRLIEALDVYSHIYNQYEYRNHTITFNPFMVIPNDETT